MDLRDSLHAVRKHWWMAVSAVLIAVGLAGVLTIRTTPQYATTMTFFVTTPGTGVTDSYQGGLFSQQRVKSYTDLLTSDRLAKAVAAKHRIALSPAEIAARVSARVLPDTVLLETTVTDADLDRSTKIAQALAIEFRSLVSTLETPPGSRTPIVKVEVVSGPTASAKPVSPQPARNLGLGFLLGAVLGIGIAVLREVLDTTVKTADALRELTSVPVLGSIPLDPDAKKAPLIISSNVHSARAEAFRQLRTNMLFVNVDRPVHCLAVTSAVPNEGKSTTACNLAIAFAEAGNTAILVEADLRRPTIAEYLDLEGAVGLTNVLAGQVELDDVIQQWGNTTLSVLPSGFIPPNPSELLGSQNMAELLDELEQRYDVVIIDTPPLVPVTDGAVVAVQADGAILVARAGKTSLTEVRAAVDALRTVDARLLGCVLNMTPVKRDADSYSYYYASGARHSTGIFGVPARQPVPAGQDSSVIELDEVVATDITSAMVGSPNGRSS